MPVKILEKKVLSDNWYTLYKYTYEINDKKGNKKVEAREAYDRGNGATILLYNRSKKTVILTRQFRLPTFVNGNQDGMMIEACAGLLDEDNAEDCIRKETEEETGYRITRVQKIYEAFMSPGSVTEIVHFFIAEYASEQKVNEGGGVEGEENIEVLELPFEQVVAMMSRGEIKDGKTIILLQYAKLHNLLS
jgi:nudix-type nucleoside diphosphatase (YffH/AdpP family)